MQEINIDLIESWDTIDPRLQDAAWHTVDGKHYGTPYSSGFNVLGYNTEVFGDTPPDSWNVVFEETDPPRWRVECGSDPGLRRPDLHRRRCPVPR